MGQGDTTAVIYHYIEKSETYRENFVFFLTRAWSPDLQFFIVIAGEHSVDLPVRNNTKYVFIPNLGHDFASYAAVAESGALNAFDRLIFVNCSVRGPFLPQYATQCWTTPYLNLLKDDVHLCGSAINILHDTRPFHALFRQRYPNAPEPFSHVQSSAHAMSGECFAFLRAQNLYAATGFDRESATVERELTMSQLVRSHGWNISCLLPPYNALDYRSTHNEINPATATGHPQAKGAYFGLTPHPFELIFVKTAWPLLSPDELDFYSLMALQHHPVPSLDWAEADRLRDDLTTRIGGPLTKLPATQPRVVGHGKNPIPAIPVASSAPSRTRCILVLGMHRSGTSALAGTLTHLGASPPNSPMEPHASNPKGFFESVRVRDFNDTLLASADSSWNDWRPIPSNWFDTSQAQALHDEAAKVIDEEFGNADLFVLKDPRICRLLPFWRTVLENRGTDILPLLTHRHPQEVAHSLKARYNYDPTFTALLWLRHQLDAEFNSRGLVRDFTSYDRLLDDPAGVTAQIAQNLDLTLPAEPALQKLDDFLSSNLRNHSISTEMQEDGLASWYRESLAIFNRWTQTCEDVAGQIRLDAIRTEFDRAVPVFAPFITRKPVV